MVRSSRFFLIAAGICAGAVNGLLGAGGGMILGPLLTAASCLQEDEVFPASVCIILPLCIVSLCLSAWEPLPFSQTVTYLLGSILGGLIAGKWGNGSDRKNRLTQAGYDYAAVQAKVNELMN